jgi:flavin reductase (DIM6/NTAB) family NADH-FMN oxidoreductase RutF
MEIDLQQKSGEEIYPILVGLVAPRPIAWVTSRSEAGILNLAPFSFFNLFGVNPPVVVFSPTLKRDGTKKDTLLNIEATQEFVIHASTEMHADQINLSSKPLPHDQSELELVKLATVPSVKISVPRLAEAPFALECRLQQVVPLGGGPLSGNLIVGEIVYIHVKDHVLDETGLPDPRKLKSIARLGGESWCRTQDLFKKSRPT